MPYSNDPFMDLARVGYEAYRSCTVSVGFPTPEWDLLPEPVKLGWRSAAKAMKLHVDDHPWPACSP